MATCPLCENEQASGDACEVCGRPLAAPRGPAPPAPAIEGLEPTLFDPVQAGEAAPIEGLEPTVREAAPDAGPPADEGDWIDRTAHDPAADVLALEPVDAVELEATALAPHEPPGRDPAAPIACRYCRTVALPAAVFCGRCGMKLEIHRASPPPRGDR